MANHDVRLAEFWDAVKARLSTARMTGLLGGAGRIYKATENFEDAEDAETKPWARLIIIPAQTLWPVEDAAGRLRRVPFLLRAEVNNFGGAGFDPLRTLEGIHDEAYGRLQHWVPTGFDDLLIVVHVYRLSAPQAMPEWDDARKLWMLSADYRTEVGATVVTP